MNSGCVVVMLEITVFFANDFCSSYRMLNRSNMVCTVLYKTRLSCIFLIIRVNISSL